MYTVSITGHRPNKLGGYNYNNKQNKTIRNKLYKILRALILNRYYLFGETDFTVVSGLALGIDTYSIHSVILLQLQLEIEYPDINIYYECAIPYKQQPNNWVSKSDVKRYYNYIQLAHQVTYVDELESYKIKGLKPEVHNDLKLTKRNYYMVDKANIIVAVWNGSNGGTKNCIEYAKTQKVTIIRFNTWGKFIEVL